MVLTGDHYDAARAQGHFVHVYVDRASWRPTALPEPLRAALQRIHVRNESF